MREVDERRIHQIFEVSVWLKGAHALIECLGGVLLYFVTTSAIASWVNAFTQEELIEDPNDFIAGHLSQMASSFSVASKEFYAFYLLSHGLIKLLLVAGLLRGKCGRIQPHSWRSGRSWSTKSTAGPTPIPRASWS